MALTEYFVDPFIAANTGTGTVGDPYGDLQFALDSVTRNATDGDRFNIKAGTDEILSSSLSLTTYGTPTAAAPLIFQGYTTAQGDRGVGGISGNGSVGIFNSTTIDYLQFIDLHLHNTSTNGIVRFDNHCSVISCELNNCGQIAIRGDTDIEVRDCNIHDCDIGVQMLGGTCEQNYFKNDGGSNDFTYAINLTGIGINGAMVAKFNIISVDGSSIGIRHTHFATVSNNSILSSSGTGQGIVESGTGRTLVREIGSHLIEGFSGTGGVGVEETATTSILLYGRNAFFNNTLNETASFAEIYLDEGDNESLGSTLFKKSGSDTFANRFAYFEPADLGNIHGGSYVNGVRRDKGAVQHVDPAGGGGGATQLVDGGIVA